MLFIAFLAGCFAASLFFAFLDRKREVDADLIQLDSYARRKAALAPVSLPPRRGESAIAFLLGHQPGGTSWSRSDGPPPTAGTGLAAVGEYEQTWTAAVASRDTCTLPGSKRAALNPPRLRAVPSNYGDGAARLLDRANGPTRLGRPVH